MLYDIPDALLITALLIAMIATVETGISVGKRYGEKTWSNAHGIHTTLTAATLALMGLLLAFTFNLSVTRYELRKTLIVSEAPPSSRFVPTSSSSLRRFARRR